MTLTAVRCAQCTDIIFSRAIHDYRKCGCGKTYVWGGLKDLHHSWRTAKPPITIKIEVDISTRQLYDDWNHRIDKYGLLSKTRIPITNLTRFSIQRQAAIKAPEF